MRLLLTLLAAGAMLPAVVEPAQAGSVFAAGSYSSSLTLTYTSDTPMGVAYDGTSYYAASGGGPQSPEGKFDNAGALIAAGAPTPGLDFRSIFTNASGTVFAKGYANDKVYQQTSFGNFTAIATLSGLTNPQEGVVLNSSGTGYVGNNNGVVQEWDLAGASTGTVTLAAPPATNNMAIGGGYWLLYGNGTLSAFNETTGALVDSTTLAGADTSYNSAYGQSYANGYFFVGNGSQNEVGYQVNLSDATPAPEPASMLLLGAGLAGLGWVRRARR